MYFRVSPAGGVQYAQVVDSSDPLNSKKILNWYVGTHFPVKSCSGTPIPYETIVTLVTDTEKILERFVGLSGTKKRPLTRPLEYKKQSVQNVNFACS
jgi:hypothetical protein